ncbi:MAG TPA: hypothetical protein VHC90_11460 [Bryobacteraceae bacterium]|nr:hypothetical protein [Bryobacteraceae bacterium]
MSIVLRGKRAMEFFNAAYNDLGRAIRKGNAPRRFDRAVAMQPLLDEMVTYWGDGVDSLFSYLWKHEGWAKIQRHVQLDLASRPVQKALNPEDKQFFANLLANFSYFDNVDKEAQTIIQGTSVDTFEDAAKFALGQIGVASPDFELKNDAIREKLFSRTDAAIFATRNHIDSVFGTIIDQFYELGQHPYSKDFVDQLRSDLGVKTEFEAKRFSLTETGIASELAQVETYRRNGVQEKRWNITGINTRPSHAELSGEEIDIADKFDVGGSAADHPLDPTLPAEELVNCHCWVSPVVGDDFQLDPTNIWEGA